MVRKEPGTTYMRLIDIHTHGIGGYDTRTDDEKDIIKMAEIQGSCGVSEIIPTIYPDTIKIMRDNMTAVKRAMDIQKARLNLLFSSIREGNKGGTRGSSAIIPGVHLEGPFLNPERCGALKAASFIRSTEYNLQSLIDGFEDIVKIITVAPELNGAVSLIKKISDKGIIASMGHSDASYTEAEAGFNAGAKGITHIFNAMRGIHHREPGIAVFGLLNKEIYIEVIADPFHIHPKTVELIFRTKNQDRIILVSDSVKGTKASYKAAAEGIINQSGRLQGGAMTLTEASKRLIEIGFDELMINNCVTRNPSAYLYKG